MTIVGERTVFGVTTRVRRQEEQTQTYENFWTDDATGNLFLHGAVNYTYGVGWMFAPPIQMVASPLSLGRAWTTEGVQAYDLDGTPWGSDPFAYPLRVFTEGSLSVPAGPFYAYGVGSDATAPPLLGRDGRSFDLLGRRVEPESAKRDGEATDWYSEGVGVVQMRTTADEAQAFKLVSHGPSVAAETPTWGKIKNAYR